MLGLEYEQKSNTRHWARALSHVIRRRSPQHEYDQEHDELDREFGRIGYWLQHQRWKTLSLDMGNGDRRALGPVSLTCLLGALEGQHQL